MVFFIRTLRTLPFFDAPLAVESYRALCCAEYTFAQTFGKGTTKNAKCKMQNAKFIKKISQLCEIIAAITGVYIFQ